MAIKGKVEFKFLDKYKQGGKLQEVKAETKNLRGTYTMFKLDNSYINN